MTYEGFNGRVDNKNHSVTFILAYEDTEPSNEQKDKDFKEMCDYIALAFAHAAEITGGSVDVAMGSGRTHQFRGGEEKEAKK